MKLNAPISPQAQKAVWIGLGCLGLLALFAVSQTWGPGRTVHNNAYEKIMLGEARQISSAANQEFSKSGADEVKFRALARYLGPEGRMASGLSVSSDGMNFFAPYYRDVPGVLKTGGYFYVRSPEWSRSRSRIDAERLAKFAVDEHTMKFETDTGAPAGTFR